ncbi:MAG: VWA domain-containing protein [Deltaproteobacteria bacterium]|nr:VWA domain-containing protein [Deltaproteobacteria bacterium]
MNVLDWQYAHQERVHLVWLALAIVGLLAFLELRSRGMMDTFLSPVMQRRLTAQASTERMIARLALIAASLLFAAWSLMQPQARGQMETVTTSTAAADVVFAIDTSRSMLAEDTAPNRLARAKAEIGQLVSRLDGHRVGLVAFAGRAAQVCPLTPDHSFFTTVLSTIDSRSAGRGGTKIGEAIKVAVRGFPQGQGAKLIVLITDGDDQDPYSEEAAKLAREAGVKIITVGLGSEAGSQITLTDPQTGAKTTLMHEGTPVISKLNGEQLRKIALATEGAYVPAGTSAIDLDSIMESYVQPIVRAAADGSVRRIPAEQFQWLVLASLLCLLGALWVGAGAGDRKGA